MAPKTTPPETPLASLASQPAPARNRAWGGFWRAVIALVFGFSLPTLACYGLILVSIVSLRLASLGGSPAGASTIRGPASGPAVGVIRVEGLLQITREPLDYGIVASSDELIEWIDQAAADSQIKAVVLAVNSPGGSVVASDVIHHALEGLDKPVVVAMGEVAASGGYYISAGADWIIANPNTLTGSIGVISQFTNAEELLEKVGVDFVVITSGPRKDFGSPYREMTPAERRYWQSMIDEIYAGFVQVVVEGRGLSEEQVLELADGSIYTGRGALELGLIDALGYEDDAIAKAAELGGIEGEPRVVEFTAPPGLFDLFRYALQRGGLPSMAEIITWIGHPTLEARWIGP